MRQIAEILRNDLGVKENNEHAPKRVTPSELTETNGAVLQWYQVAPEDRQVADEIDRLTRSFLARIALEARRLGFVVLHRCGNDLYFLIFSTWRGHNEVWETVFYKDGDAMADFALWPRDGMQKPTFCVWELAPVWHETKSCKKL